MPVAIRKSTVGDFNGLILENEKVRAVVLPGFGARIISLIYKPTETDFAWHNPSVPIRKPSYEIDFEDVSGFFDCVPTCEPCTFKGRKLPPAGEVWAAPWRLLKVVRGPKSVTVRMERACEVYPLLVRKNIRLNRNESALRLQYTLRNLSDEKLEFHYTGHNTMSVTPNTRIVLPKEVTKVKLGMAVTDRLGNLGDEISWPQTVAKDGRTVDLSKLVGPCAGFGENLYTRRLKETWVAAINEARKEAIGFSWPAEALPFILVWINNGGWRGYFHAALEPSSGRPDNLEMAVNEWKDYASIEPRGRLVWDESIILAHGIEKIEKIEHDEIVQG